MDTNSLKRPRVFIPAVLVTILVFVLVLIFDASFQKNLLLRYVGPEMDTLSVERIHLTPWSLTIENLQAGYQGAQFRIDSGIARYNPLSLFFARLNVKEISLNKVDIDISRFAPPASQEKSVSALFPGLFPLLDYGLGYQLDTVAADAVVKLPGNQSLLLKISGGGVKPEQAGNIEVNGDFYTGKDKEVISFNNALALVQLTGGRFSSLENKLNLSLALQALPQTETISITVTATPADTGDELNAACNNNKFPCIIPENYTVVVKQDNHDGKNRSLLSVTGNYDGNNGALKGDYALTATELLLQPYAGKNRIPIMRENLSGRFDLQLADHTGNITLINNLQVSDLQNLAASKKAPQILALKTNLQVFLLAKNRLRIATFDANLTDEKEIRPLTANIPSEMDMPLDDIKSFLQQDKVLLEFALPEIPIVWLNFLIPDYEIIDGRLAGKFQVSTDQASNIYIKPLEPLALTNLTVLQGDEKLIDQFNMSLLPELVYKNESMRITLDQFSVVSPQGELAGAKLASTLYLEGERQGTVNASVQASLNLHNALAHSTGSDYSDTNVPKRFDIEMDAALQHWPDAETLKVSTLNAEINKDKTRLLQLELVQPVVLNTALEKKLLASEAGDIARLVFSDIQLNWLSAFIPGMELQGQVHEALISLSIDANNNTVIHTSKAIKVKDVNVISNGDTLLEDIDVEVSPGLLINDKGVAINYEDLKLTGNSLQLVAGKGDMLLPKSEQEVIAATGFIDIDLQAISTQPVLARVLGASISSPVHFESSYALAVNESSIAISSLSANLVYSDSQPRIALAADSGVTVRTSLKETESEVVRASGKLTFDIQNLTPEPFADILSAWGISFKDITGKAELISDGETLTLESLEPFTISDIDISNEQGSLLHPFDVFMGGALDMQGKRININIEPFGLAFAIHDDVRTIDGQLEASLSDNDGVTWLDVLNTSLTISLPELLDQPSILPRHKLKTGQLDAEIHLASDGELDAAFKIDNLKSKRALPLEVLEFTITGNIDADTSFSLEAPLRALGKTGTTDVLITAEHIHFEDRNNFVDVSFDSSVFYLNDMLDFLDQIAATIDNRKGKNKKKDTKRTEPAENNVEPDTKAFWDVTAYDVNTRFEIDQLYYTEFLVINNISGDTVTSPTEFHLNNLQAFFQDSPITLDSDINFIKGAKPYELAIKAGIQSFNMKQFYNQLMPTATPRSEGLFNISFDASGKTPNMPQLRNELLFDLNLNSTDGFFHLLDPDSILIGGATNILGGVGEGVSYLPTGMFGLGAVSRLVDYIQVINYDLMSINLVRDDSKNVTIREYVVQNPELLMTARGGIDYEEGVDILNSPLNMTAHLDFRGKGAAIMYDLNLLADERDEYGYWIGTVIEFSGTPANNLSNLDDIVSKAGNAAILGGVTRPFSGLIGNAKHRWFGDDVPPVPYKKYRQEAKQDN